ncbi:MAG: DUF192 domain-containing protein [Candidatus Binataceae bacterium]
MKPPIFLRAKLLAASVFALALCATFAACADSPRVAIIAAAGATRAIVNVEIANTPSARELGLMYRQHLDEHAGMIFVFPSPDHLTFWMKNTDIPLDMIFADSAGRILGIVESATPFSESPRGVDGESLYVLEVNGGFAKRHRLHTGDRLNFRGFAPHASE